jgi:hypothetical protein
MLLSWDRQGQRYVHDAMTHSFRKMGPATEQARMMHNAATLYSIIFP